MPASGCRWSFFCVLVQGSIAACKGLCLLFAVTGTLLQLLPYFLLPIIRRTVKLGAVLRGVFLACN